MEKIPSNIFIIFINCSKKFCTIYNFVSDPKGCNTNINFGKRVKTEIKAKSIAIPVNTPKYIVGIKFDRTKIEKPKTIVIDVFNIAIPTVLWHLSTVFL